ncbi:MAG: DUF1214 domain-containing protein [Xanthobacteraceae bacterium]|nr:DUF1214 domain-containing protein [Xanthobacteraceae bacterium]
MRLIFSLILAMAIAAVVGLGLTFTTATKGVDFGTLKIGAWTARPRIGTSNVDPYARATIARNGELPVGAGDGITFLATKDDTGRALDGRCDVVVSGVTPAARFWTLTLYDPKGHLVANTVRRYGFTSQEVVRGSDGSFKVQIASHARSGNWLPAAGVGQYTLALRLYDTPVGVATRSRKDAPLPAITRATCS